MLFLLDFMLGVVEGKGHFLLVVVFKHLICHDLIHLICNFVQVVQLIVIGVTDEVLVDI